MKKIYSIVPLSFTTRIMDSSKEHWEKIYAAKKAAELSWTQEIPATSLRFIHSFHLHPNASIIDIGAGESKFVDFLLDEGFTNLTVLDISEEALRKTRERLGSERAARVKWIAANVLDYKPLNKFDVWHDRATFHFLTGKEQIAKYVELASHSLNAGGYMAIGTFSDKGPSKCSGLDVRQYTEAELEETLTYHFKKIRCIAEDHVTPFSTRQNFLFCSFKRAA